MFISIRVLFIHAGLMILLRKITFSNTFVLVQRNGNRYKPAHKGFIHKENYNRHERKKTLMIVEEKLRKLQGFAETVYCQVSDRITKNNYCNYDTMCTYKEDPVLQRDDEKYYDDLYVMRYYRKIFMSFTDVLKNVTAYESQQDTKIYNSIRELKKKYISVAIAFGRAVKFFKRQTDNGNDVHVPDVFFSFPSKDYCVVKENLDKEKQVALAIKSLRSFSIQLMYILTNRHTPVIEML